MKLRRIGAIIKALYWWIKLVQEPNRLNYVIELSDSLMHAGSSSDLNAYVSAVKGCSKAESAFNNRLRLNPVNLKSLETLPANTLGKHYSQFLKENNLCPADLPEKKHSHEIEYLQAHLFETHDIWHVVTGFKPDIPGELSLQAFYIAQLPSTTAFFILAAGLLNAVFNASPDKEQRVEAISRGWSMGKKAKKLFGTEWDLFWETDLTRLRYEFTIVGAA